MLRCKSSARVRVYAALLPLMLVLLLPLQASSAPAGSRVGDWCLYGSNMPWLNWNADFGGGATGGGVSGNAAQLDAKLQAAANAGMHLIRWWVFEGGSPQIQRDASGMPTGIDPRVYTDLDAALNEAATYDIYYDFVLFGGTNDDATTHQWWEDSAKRQALAAVLTPLFQRYASNPRVHTWELVNEPEWQSRNGQTTVSGMLATGDALANAAHANSPALVTVGHAQIQDMQTWAGHPLDYYSPHYYDNFGTGSNDPFVTTADSPDGKPVVIGEFPAASGMTPDAQTRWQAVYDNGYAGAWNWSLSPEHTYDQIATDFDAASAFAQDKTDLGPQSSGTATPVRVPSATASMPVAATNQAAWTLRASETPSVVSRGGSVTVSLSASVNHTTTALVNVEIYDPKFKKIYQHAWDNQPFAAHVARAYSTTWSVPAGAAAGTYTVKIGTFKTAWNGLYALNDNVVTFHVQ